MLTAKLWAELKEGWGLQEVPRDLVRSVPLGCAMCGYINPGAAKLYTDQAVEPGYYDGTMHAYQRARIKMEDNLRHNCYCRYHAEQMFGERDET